ncbi:MAG: hypothetical protein JW893_09360 [Candidatus Omnitrophica bacterium]|nr:hypothetical protein [Candidatus Omnitrophota bacterium]
MAQHKPTPEEQLLKLIENPSESGKGQSGGRAGKPQPAIQAKKPLIDFSKWFGIFSYFKSQQAKTTQAAKIVQPVPVFTIKLVNRIMILMVFVAAIYLVLDLTLLKQDEGAFLAQVSTTDAVFPIQTAPAALPQNQLDHYQKPLTERNPFLPFQAEVTDENMENVPLPAQQSNRLAKIMQTLELVGISWGADEPLAMIEDTTTGRTYFLRRGQEIKGVKVQIVEKDSVTVTYEGEETKLI